MINKIKSVWKGIMALAGTLVVFLLCMFPYRAIMNYHEQRHLFRWNAYYLKEQFTSLDGIGEYFVSWITQFFYIGWLGAALMALLALVIQQIIWGVFRLIHINMAILYPLTFIPSALLFYYVFIPQEYKNDSQFREAVEYDYLIRAHEWNKILGKSYNHPPETMNGIWCTNYALAMKGTLLDDMFYYKQDGPDGLLMDALRMQPLALYSLSDISFEIGMINNAERFAFDAKQRLPNGRKSGRLYKRLTETNIINGNNKVAKKYKQILKSTLFYNNIVDKDLVRYRTLRQKGNDELAQAKDQILKQLAIENPNNKLACNYLLAYEMLRLDLEHLTEYTLLLKNRDNWKYTPKAIQEAVIGYWILKHPNDSLPFSVNKDIFNNTAFILREVQSSGNMTPASLEVPPYCQSYWHYHTQALVKLKQLHK